MQNQPNSPIFDVACAFLDYLDVYYDRADVAVFVATWTHMTTERFQELNMEFGTNRRNRCLECGTDMGPHAETRQLCGKIECMNHDADL